jgi:hypothetical protein
MCIYAGCEYMIASPMNIANLRYHMYIVLYFGVLIEPLDLEEFANIYIYTYIYRVTT